MRLDVWIKDLAFSPFSPPGLLTLSLAGWLATALALVLGRRRLA